MRQGLPALGRRHRRWIRGSMLAFSLITALSCWMLVQHKPGWYTPPRLDEVGRRAARRDATARADDFGDKLVRRRPFELVLQAADINRWLASAPELWPQAEGAALRDPVICFEDGMVRLGALVERRGWRAVVSAGVSVALSADGQSVEVRLLQVRGGSFPIPLAVLAWAGSSSPGREADQAAEPAESIDSLVSDLASVDELLSGIVRRNRFVWPNGRRAFSIDELTVADGRLTLRIRPH